MRSQIRFRPASMKTANLPVAIRTRYYAFESALGLLLQAHAPVSRPRLGGFSFGAHIFNDHHDRLLPAHSDRTKM